MVIWNDRCSSCHRNDRDSETASPVSITWRAARERKSASSSGKRVRGVLPVISAVSRPISWPPVQRNRRKTPSLLSVKIMSGSDFARTCTSSSGTPADSLTDLSPGASRMVSTAPISLPAGS